MKVVEYYIQRWKVERFHYVLKSGCSVEKIQQRTYEKIKPMLLIYSVIAMFIMTVTYIGRVLPDTPCDVFFDTDEWQILYRIIHKTKIPPSNWHNRKSRIIGTRTMKIGWQGCAKNWAS